MPRGRPWSRAEDDELRHVVKLNRSKGLRRRQVVHELKRRGVPAFAERLRAFAERHGRSYAAVRKRASRLGLRSTPTRVAKPRPRPRLNVTSDFDWAEFINSMFPSPERLYKP